MKKSKSLALVLVIGGLLAGYIVHKPALEVMECVTVVSMGQQWDDAEMEATRSPSQSDQIYLATLQQMDSEADVLIDMAKLEQKNPETFQKSKVELESLIDGLENKV